MNNSLELQTAARVEQARREEARRHFIKFEQYRSPWFKTNWHHELVAGALERVENGSLKRLIILEPPRHGKSNQVSVDFPPWVLGRNRDKNIILASYSDDLALDFGREARNIVDSEEYKRVFTTRLSEDSKAKGTWATNGRGKYNAVGVGGSVTGKGADVLIIDDPVKNRVDADSEVVQEKVYSWYKSTARTRLSPNGAIIICITRWNDNDLVGKILADDVLNQWEIISLPAIAEVEDDPDRPYDRRRIGEALWPEQFDTDNLTLTKADVGLVEWSALFQQNPINGETQEFRESMFMDATWDEVQAKHTALFVTVDTASRKKRTSDFTGVVRNNVEEDGTYNIRASRERMDSTELVKFIFDVWVNEKPEAIGIEETAFMDAVYPFFVQESKRRNIYPNVVGLKHHGTGKETRIRGLLPRYNAKAVNHVVGQCADLEQEELRFPKGKHDDVVDALAYQDQIAFPPLPLQSYVEEAYNDMQIDPKTGYYKTNTK